MKAVRVLLFTAAALTALMPGVITWVMLCSEALPRNECISRLTRFDIRLGGDVAKRSPQQLSPIGDIGQHDVPEATGMAAAGPGASFGNLSFTPSDIKGARDLLVAVVSDWSTFTGPLGAASREWARYLLGQKKHTFAVIYFVGQCPGLAPSKSLLRFLESASLSCRPVILFSSLLILSMLSLVAHAVGVLYAVDGTHMLCLNVTDGYPVSVLPAQIPSSSLSSHYPRFLFAIRSLAIAAHMAAADQGFPCVAVCLHVFRAAVQLVCLICGYYPLYARRLRTALCCCSTSSFCALLDTIFSFVLSFKVLPVFSSLFIRIFPSCHDDSALSISVLLLCAVFGQHT